MSEANATASLGVPFSVNHQPRIALRRKSPYSQALELQDLLMKDAREATLKPVSRAIVARAWRELEQLKREIKMKPKPKPATLDEIEKAKRRKGGDYGFSGPRRPGPVEPPVDG
jgi:hypothetical protein